MPNDSDQTSDKTAAEPGAGPPAAAVCLPLTNPKLSETLQGECEALRNDLQQAQELAADFQRQLASKSNEVATMKNFFERTRGHLMQLQSSIKELRQERHRLANEVMRAAATEHELVAERDLLRKTLRAVEKGLEGSAADLLRLAGTCNPQLTDPEPTKMTPDVVPARELILPATPTSDLEIKWIG